MFIKLTKDVIGRIQLSAEKALEFLERLNAQAEKEIAKNAELLYAYLYCFLVFSQAILTMANYLIVKMGFRIPRNFQETLMILIDEDVISENLESAAKILVELRNIALHYWTEITPEVIRSIAENASAFKEIYGIVKDQVSRTIKEE